MPNSEELEAQAEAQANLHDTPTLEQRVANLESVTLQATIDLKTLTGRVKRVWDKVFQRTAPPNCKHCGRQVLVPRGQPCPLCGKKP